MQMWECGRGVTGGSDDLEFPTSKRLTVQLMPPQLQWQRHVQQTAQPWRRCRAVPVGLDHRRGRETVTRLALHEQRVQGGESDAEKWIGGGLERLGTERGGGGGVQGVTAS